MVVLVLKKIIINVFAIAIAAILVIYYLYGRSRYEKLGETSFFKNRIVELKVITRYEYLPLHYSGDAYSIACKTTQTSNFKEIKSSFIEQGWNAVPSIALKCEVEDGIKCDHKKLSEEAKKYFHLFDSSTIVSVTEYGVYVSFNGCQTFSQWSVADFYNKIKIKESNESIRCQENISREVKQGIQNSNYINCFYLNFIENNRIVFSKINASDKGTISFWMTSKAFKDDLAIIIESSDFGKTWLVKPSDKEI